MDLLKKILVMLLDRFRERQRMGRPLESSRAIADLLSLCLSETKSLNEMLLSRQPSLRCDGKNIIVGWETQQTFLFSVSELSGMMITPKRLL